MEGTIIDLSAIITIAMWGVIAVVFGCIIMYKSVLLWLYSLKVKHPLILIKHPTFLHPMINEKTYKKLAKFLFKNKNKEVGVVLHTDGGTIFDSIRISKLFLLHKKVTVIVPEKAMSGGTLLSIMANKLVCGSNASFGDLNPQFMAFSFMKILGEKSLKKNIGKSQLQERIYLDWLKNSKNELKKLISKKNPELANYLTSGNESHGEIITAKQLEKYGIVSGSVKSALPFMIIRH